VIETLIRMRTVVLSDHSPTTAHSVRGNSHKSFEAEQERKIMCSDLLRTVQSPWKHGLSLLLKLNMMLAGAVLRTGPDTKGGDARPMLEAGRVSAAFPAEMRIEERIRNETL
jgi:hypothetical protein